VATPIARCSAHPAAACCAPPRRATTSADSYTAGSATVTRSSSAYGLLVARITVNTSADDSISLWYFNNSSSFGQTVASLPAAGVTVNASAPFSATALDQLCDPLPVQPTFEWSVSGGVGIDGADHVVFSGLTGSAFSLTITRGEGAQRWGISGLQIIRRFTPERSLHAWAPRIAASASGAALYRFALE